MSEDAQGAARAIQANYFKEIDSEETFSISTTHNLESWNFSKGAIDSLAAHLLRKAFRNDAGNIDRYDSCRESVGRKYRPSHKKLAEKVLKMDGKEFVKRRETVDALAELEDRVVAEVQSDIYSYGYDYGVYKNSAK